MSELAKNKVYVNFAANSSTLYKMKLLDYHNQNPKPSDVECVCRNEIEARNKQEKNISNGDVTSRHTTSK